MNTLDITNYDGQQLERFFDHLTLPSLSHFTFHGELGDETPRMSSMLTRSSTFKALVHLGVRIHSIRSMEPLRWHLSQIMEAAPHVETLEILCKCENYFYTAADEVFEILTIADGRRLLPKVQTLVYTPEWLRGLGNGEALVNMMASRRHTNRGSSVSQLVSVCIIEYSSFQRLWEGITASALAKLREFSREKVLSVKITGGYNELIEQSDQPLLEIE